MNDLSTDQLIAQLQQAQGPSTDQLIAMLQQQRQERAGIKQGEYNPTEGTGTLQRFTEGAGQGVTDLAQGAQQLGAHIADSAGAMEMLNKARQALGMEPVSVAQVDQQTAEKAKIDKALLDTTAGKVGSIAGQTAVTAPLLPVGSAGATAGFLAKAAAAARAGAVAGGTLGVLQPTTDSEFLKAKLEQGAVGAGTGALGGAALNTVGQGLVKVLPGNIPATIVNALTGKASKSAFAQEGEQLAQQTGIDLTPAMVSGGKAITQAENLARQSIFSRSQAFAADQKIAQQWTDYVQRTIDGVSSGGGTPAEIGSRIQGAVKNAVSDLSDARETAAAKDYGQIRTLLAGKPAIMPSNLQQALKDQIEELSTGPKGSDYEKIASSLRSMYDKVLDNADVGNMIKTRRFLSQVAGGQVNLGGETGKGLAKRAATSLLDAIDQDLDQNAQRLGGDVGQMLQQANARYRGYSEQIDGLKNSALGKLLGQDFADALGNGTFNSIPGETVMSRFAALKPSQIDSARQILTKYDPETWQAAKRSILEAALNKAQQAAPSEGANAVAAKPGAFYNELAKTPEAMTRLSAMFEPNEMRSVQAALDAAQRISDKTGFNFPGTAAAAEGYAVAHTLFNPSALPGIATQAITSRSIASAMSNSQGRAVMIEMARLPPGSARFRQLATQLAAMGADDDMKGPGH